MRIDAKQNKKIQDNKEIGSSSSSVWDPANDTTEKKIQPYTKL